MPGSTPGRSSSQISRLATVCAEPREGCAPGLTPGLHSVFFGFHALTVEITLPFNSQSRARPNLTLDETCPPWYTFSRRSRDLEKSPSLVEGARLEIV